MLVLSLGTRPANAGNMEVMVSMANPPLKKIKSENLKLLRDALGQPASLPKKGVRLAPSKPACNLKR